MARPLPPGAIGGATASTGAFTTITATTSISPTADDGAALGDLTHNFSDLFLATGAVINYANSNVVLTHSSGILTLEPDVEDNNTDQYGHQCGDN